MASKKVNIFTLSALIAMMMLSGCKDKNSKTNNNFDPEEWQRSKIEECERDRFIFDFADSCAYANCGHYACKDYELKFLQDSIGEINFQNSANGALSKAVNDAGTKIIDRYFKEIRQRFYVLGIQYDEKLLKLALYSSEFIFYGVNADRGGVNDSIYDKENVQRCIQDMWSCTNIETYDNDLEIPEAESIKAYTNYWIIYPMCQELYKSRKSIEAKYAKYFAGGMNHINQIGVFGYGEIWDAEIGRFTEVDNWVTERGVSVYSHNIPKSFCADTNAKYKLKQVGNSEWCIVKILPNGKRVESDTFVYDAAFDTIMYPESNSLRKNKDSFLFWERDTMGGMINYSEVIKIERPRVKYPKSAGLSRQSAQLIKRYDKMYTEKHEYDSCYNEARNLAIKQWNERHNKGNCR